MFDPIILFGIYVVMSIIFYVKIINNNEKNISPFGLLVFWPMMIVALVSKMFIYVPKKQPIINDDVGD
jgi:hypothetical protein